MSIQGDLAVMSIPCTYMICRYCTIHLYNGGVKLENRVELAKKCFKEGFNCSQAVFSSYCDLLGLDKETGLKISCAFGAGMGREQEVCGAVSGALMLIGLKYGNIKENDKEAKEKTYAKTKELCDSFKSTHGTIICRELLGCDINTPEGRKYADEHKLFTTKCVECVEISAKIIEDILFED